MEELITAFMESPESGFTLVKTMVEKYKPMAYEIGNIVLDIYKDFSNNQEYFETVAKVKKNMFDAYIEAGFSEDQAFALIINDNIQRLNYLKKQSLKSSATKKGK